MADLNLKIYIKNTNISYTLKILYLYDYNAYGYQTWQGGDLSQGAPTHKVKWPFNLVVLQNHEPN